MCLVSYTGVLSHSKIKLKEKPLKSLTSCLRALKFIGSSAATTSVHTGVMTRKGGTSCNG